MKYGIIAVLLFFFVPSNAADGQPVICIGQRLDYEIRAEIKVPILNWVLNPLVGGKVGSGFISITRTQTQDGPVEYHAVADGGAEKVGMVSMFERAESWFGPDLLARRYIRYSTNKSGQKVYRFQYDREKNLVHSTTSGEGGYKTEFLGPPNVNDPMTGFFYICQQDLRVGEVIFLNTHTDSTLEQAKIVVLAEETEVIRGVEEKLLRLEISSRANIFQHQDKFTLWVLRERNIPYKVEANVPVIGLNVVKVEIKLKEDSLF